MSTPQAPPDAAPEPIPVAVLDDDADFRAYIEDFLAGEGRYRVATYAEPEHLFAALAVDCPGIVLLDMQMGQTRGADVLERLLTLHPGLCVIVVTGYPSLEDMRATFKLNAFDYLSKPFSLQQMRQVLANAEQSYALGRAPADQLRQRLGQRIRLLRAERDWSLKDLAQSARLSVSQISSIERGANLPSMESLLSLARSFGKRPSDLLSSIDF
jgi:DNA-binding NtrC family response regulator